MEKKLRIRNRLAREKAYFKWETLFPNATLVEEVRREEYVLSFAHDGIWLYFGKDDHPIRVEVSPEFQRELWAKDEPIEVDVYREVGSGYGGGHNSVGYNFQPRWAEPKPDAVIWWQTSHRGSFTGFWTVTLSLVLAIPEHKASENL
jgi:hypothetical protein